jgi:Cys-tRNA(Pro)/Cys-tRNA(Cys) deacylase
MAELDTRVIRLLEAQGVPYRLLPHDEPVYTVEAAARQRGVKQEEMVKSILLRDKDRHYVMACVTGEARLDTKAVRVHLPAGWKRLTFATAGEIAEITGFEMGAVAPLGLAADIPVIFDEAISRRTQVNISSGDPLAGLELDPADLIRLAQAKLAPIAML